MDKRRSGAGYRYWNLSLYRAREEHDFVPREVAFVQQALPHLLEAQTINRVANLSVTPECVAGSTNGLGIADSGGTFLHCEPRLRSLLRQEWPDCRADAVPSHLWDRLTRQQTYLGRHIAARGTPVQGLIFIRARPVCAADSLTARERAVARCAAEGQSHKQIARVLGMEPSTARSHLQRIREKLGAHNMAEVIAQVRRLG